MKNCTCRKLLFIALLLLSNRVWADVNICVHNNSHWAPYVYQNNKTGDTEGISADIIKHVFERLKLPYRLSPTPWARIHTETYSADMLGGCEVVWDIAKSSTRREQLRFSMPIYKVKSGAFYSKSVNPQLKQLNSIHKIFSYDVCGIRGYDYGPATAAISLHVAHRIQALKLLELGRCDLFINAYESVVFGARVDSRHLDTNIEFIHAKVFDREMHAAVSQHSSRSKLLLDGINDALNYLHNSGDLERIFIQHIGLGSGL